MLAEKGLLSQLKKFRELRITTRKKKYQQWKTFGESSTPKNDKPQCEPKINLRSFSELLPDMKAFSPPKKYTRELIETPSPDRPYREFDPRIRYSCSHRLFT